MNMNTNILIIVIIFFLIVTSLGGGLGYYFYSSSTTPPPKTEVESEKDINTTSSGTKARQVVSGQYVRIRQPTVGCLNIADIKVMSNNTNISKGKTVTMSSVYGSDYVGTFLVDEIFTNIAHTSCNDAGWMMIDLGSSQVIDSVIVYNRTDCCSGRTLGAVIEILDSSKTVVYTSDPFADKNGSTTFLPVADITGIKTYTMNPPSKTVVFA
jgi:hypothetical protein